MSDTPVYIPPEWAPQAAVWVGWPHIRGEWGTAFEAARLEIARFIEALSAVTPVKVACGSREAYTSAWLAFGGALEARVTLHTLPAGDIWLRDTGPIIARRSDKGVALQFQFNGWGGKYIMPGDTMTASAIASVERLALQPHPFVLEGGAVDLDGAGRLLTTRQCILNPNRNQDWDEGSASSALRQAFGIEDVIWLGEGLLNDHTDGHVDNIARFIGPGRVLCQSPSGEHDPNRQRLAAIEADLRRAGLDVALVPSPGLITDETGETMPASHMNFLISNGRVFLPIYDERYGPQAASALTEALPGYKVITLPAKAILTGGGAFHCMTQQVPAL